MILILFLFGLALGAESPSGEPEVKLQRGNCPMFWYNFKDRCYKYVATRMTWADAEFHCLSEGTNLVSIHSQGEDDFVKSLIKNSDPAMGLTWIGLSDTQKEGLWMWSDGSAGTFRSWHQGQPDNAGGREHCAEYHVNRWNDVQCSDSYPFVCKTRLSCN